jgi:YHS domain-containing protein
MSMHSHGWRLSPGQWATVFGAIVLPVTAAFFLVGASRAYACPGDGCCGGGAEPANEPAKEAAKQDVAKPQGLLVDLANAKCPVMGGKPDGRTWSEWNGVRVGHCCAGCTKKFATDPEKYLAATGLDWKPVAAAVKKVNEAKGADRDKALSELKQKWIVVREPVPPAPQGTLIDLKNATCPVMGGEVDGATWSEWNGLRVGHCCPGCGAKFLREPEKYLDAAGIEWKAAAAAVKSVDAAAGEARTKALATLKAKWTVLREPAPDLAPAKDGSKSNDAPKQEDAKK